MYGQHNLDLMGENQKLVGRKSREALGRSNYSQNSGYEILRDLIKIIFTYGYRSNRSKALGEILCWKMKDKKNDQKKSRDHRTASTLPDVGKESCVKTTHETKGGKK